jgi:hypothetical protein
MVHRTSDIRPWDEDTGAYEARSEPDRDEDVDMAELGAGLKRWTGRQILSMGVVWGTISIIVGTCAYLITTPKASQVRYQAWMRQCVPVEMESRCDELWRWQKQYETAGSSEGK